MRIVITLESDRPLVLPVHYNALVQGLIYHQLEPNLAAWLHEEAYRYEKRKFTMFTFSRLSGRFSLDQKTKRITFSGPVSFSLASYNSNVLASLAEHLLKCQRLHLGTNAVEVRGVEILKPPRIDADKPVRVRALSPITIHSTLDKPGGGKLTHYYEPLEGAWDEMLAQNLARKAKALGWEADAFEALEGAAATPLRVSHRDRKIVGYKGFTVQGWLGVYELRLPEAYFWLAYDVGLGARNAQGFGMIEVC